MHKLEHEDLEKSKLESLVTRQDPEKMFHAFVSSPIWVQYYTLCLKETSEMSAFSNYACLQATYWKQEVRVY